MKKTISTEVHTQQRYLCKDIFRHRKKPQNNKSKLSEMWKESYTRNVDLHKRNEQQQKRNGQLCIFFFLHIKVYLEKIITFLKQNSKVFWVVIAKMAVQLLDVTVTNRL